MQSEAAPNTKQVYAIATAFRKGTGAEFPGGSGTVSASSPRLRGEAKSSRGS